MLRAVKARLWFLPNTPPDVNPIEQTFAKIKHWMRFAQKTNAEDACELSATSSQTSNPANAKLLH
jgi:putative transposase